jgi:hypothetical protein
MTFEERIAQLDNYFKNIQTEQFIKDLFKAGLGEIKSIRDDNVLLDEYTNNNFYTIDSSFEEYSSFDCYQLYEVA